MSAITEMIEQDALVLHFDSLPHMNDHEFFMFCQQNEPWRFERTSEGNIQIMVPAGGESGNRGIKLGARLEIWTERNGTGLAFDSSTGFRLPNGAVRSPDLAWVRAERWNRLSKIEREEFVPLCPDFVVEVRSKSDRLGPLKAKMREYIENGAQLGWLIDPYERQVYVYRPGVEVECLNNPEKVSGEPVLAGFELELGKVW